MKKIESDYKDKYSSVSSNEITRFGELLSSIKISPEFRRTIFSMINHNLNIQWNSVSFVIYLLPKATPRPRHSFRTNTFYVMGAKDNKDIFKEFISKQDIDMITTPCKFRCISYLPIPNSMNNIEKVLAELGLIYPISKPDWDNLGKTYSDMIQGTLLFDDSLIVEGVSKKLYSTKPRIEITIDYMSDYDSNYNMKKIRKKVK
jgi:Holliday junction resolvase RusA-like endonuclease